jgi:hypothetical protein
VYLWSSAKEECDLSKIDVVIVEDDDSVRDATSHLLRVLGYAKASFSSAEDFLKSGRETGAERCGAPGLGLQAGPALS